MCERELRTEERLMAAVFVCVRHADVNIVHTLKEKQYRNHIQERRECGCNHQFDYAKSSKMHNCWTNLMTHMANVDLTIRLQSQCVSWTSAMCTLQIAQFFFIVTVAVLARALALCKSARRQCQWNRQIESIRWLRARTDIKINGWKSRMKMAHTNNKEEKQKKKHTRNDNDDGVNYFRWQTNREHSKCVPHWTNENFPSNFFYAVFAVHSLTFYSAHKSKR